MGPLVFGFTGRGNVALGAQRIFELLPVEMIAARDLPRRVAELDREAESAPLRRVYGVYLGQEDIVRKRQQRESPPSGSSSSPSSSSSAAFDREDYYADPASYEPVFHEAVAPHLSVFVNGMYWDPRFPRLLTIDQLRGLAASARDAGRRELRLRAIADVTGDIDGSLEMSTRATTFQQPYLEWDAEGCCEPSPGSAVGSVPFGGVVVSTVDILPTGLPREATKHFGDALLPILEDCLDRGIPEVLRSACITDEGQLLPRYQFIQVSSTAKKTIESNVKCD